VILYTMFMLPPASTDRARIYRKVLAAGCRLHCAVEGFALGHAADIERWENVLQTAEICRDLKYQEIERWLV
jgi:sporadic carbohydrate cluster protein (TIGR04323 family)